MHSRIIDAMCRYELPELPHGHVFGIEIGKIFRMFGFDGLVSPFRIGLVNQEAGALF